MPQLYLLEESTADNLENFVAGGGHLPVSYPCGVVDANDANDAVDPQGLAGPPGDLLGIDVQEFAPFPLGGRVTMILFGRNVSADVWVDRLVPTEPTTQVLA